MKPTDTIGTWFLDGCIPLAKSELRINGKWTFAADGTATFDEHYTMQLGERVLNVKNKKTEGRWTIISD